MLSHPRHRPGRSRHLTEVVRDPDGTLRLRGGAPPEAPSTLLALLDAAAKRNPDRTFLARRDRGNAWEQVTYAAVAERSWCIASGLRALGASAQRPLVILSGNGIEHALMSFGAMRAGIPVVPIVPRAGLAARDGFARLRAIVEAVQPGVVFAHDGPAYAAGVRAVLRDTPYVTVTEPPRRVRAMDYAALLAHRALIDDAVTIAPSTVAKLLFSPTVTGRPKAVITTHAMLCAMLEAVTEAWPFLAAEPPTVVDWLPWHHAFGGNLVFGLVLRHSGTLFVDDGDPTPAGADRSARLRADIPPTLAFDVPLGWAAWAARLRANEALRQRWTSRLRVACWGGAAMPVHVRDALLALDVPLCAYWGATETSPAITLTREDAPPADALGAPLGGVELKLVPRGKAYEARVRGPQVTPGYWQRDDLRAEAFDEDGYYRLGDLVRPLDARHPERGLAYVSRLDARFKLSSGTWVRAAAIRERFLHECGAAVDAFVSGEGRSEVGMIVWPVHATREAHEVLRGDVVAALRRATTGEGASGGAQRAIIVDAEPAASAVESLVERLHAPTPDEGVIVVAER